MTQATQLKFQPYADRLVIKVDEDVKQTDGGLYLPEQATKKLNQGTVIAAGPGRETSDGKLIPTKSQVNDRVLFSKYSGSEIEIDKETYLVIVEKDVLGRLG